jgi:hypothetical protein
MRLKMKQAKDNQVINVICWIPYFEPEKLKNKKLTLK